MKFPREQTDSEWIISVEYLKDIKSKIENQISKKKTCTKIEVNTPLEYLPYLDLEEIEAVLLVIEIADNQQNIIGTTEVQMSNKNERPKHWMPRKGDCVDYHSIIGEEITSTHIVESVGTDYAGQAVAWISGKSGYVACDALTPVVMP